MYKKYKEFQSETQRNNRNIDKLVIPRARRINIAEAKNNILAKGKAGLLECYNAILEEAQNIRR